MNEYTKVLMSFFARSCEEHFLFAQQLYTIVRYVCFCVCLFVCLFRVCVWKYVLPCAGLPVGAARGGGGQPATGRAGAVRRLLRHHRQTQAQETPTENRGGQPGNVLTCSYFTNMFWTDQVNVYQYLPTSLRVKERLDFLR